MAAVSSPSRAQWTFELVAGPFESAAAAPVWDGEGLLFSVAPASAEQRGSRILRYDPRGGQTSEYRRYSSRIRGLAFDAEGRLYGAQASSRRIVRYNPDG